MSIAELPASQLPTHLDLPYTDNKPVDNTYQQEQSYLLTSSLRPHLGLLHPDGKYFTAADCGIYWVFRKKNPLEGCKAPDWFYVPNVPATLGGILRKSYVMWQELVPPLLVVELVSGDGREERDQTPEKGKFWVYENRIKVAYYAIHDPFRNTLEVFELVRGRYKSMKPDSKGRFRIPAMKLDLGIWEGFYYQTKTNWLRGWDWDGILIPTSEEIGELEHKRAEQERQRAEQERQRAEQERQRAESFAARLRELGIDPDKI
jgi:Uma2 family endonuclease